MLWNLCEKIEKKRKEMIKVGMSKGFTDEETIAISRELDELINAAMFIPAIFNSLKRSS